ncbi:MAG: 2-oxoglutarate and iron-dependent oxygenase domain-containing protein [Pseudomonadota bacterium]
MDRLPTISIAGLRDGNEDAIKRIAGEIGTAAREIGFFRVCDHGIPLSLIDETYETARNFFAQSDEAKRRYYIALSSNHRGYVPFSERGDYPDEANRSYEAFDLGLDLPGDDPDYLAGNRLLGPNVWPELSGFREVVSTYYQEISALGRALAECLEINLGLPKGKMTRLMSKPISQLRLLHYVRQPHTKDHSSVNMGAHTDYECLTLLHTRNQGLQVMTQDDRWIDVPVDPALFVVNIGDMLEAWSNGIFRSTPHRVLNLSAERYSLPYFVAANYDCMIAPFDQLVSPDRPARYEPFMAGAHLERMLVRDFPYLRDYSRAEAQKPGPIGAAPSHNPFETRLQRGAS